MSNAADTDNRPRFSAIRRTTKLSADAAKENHSLSHRLHGLYTALQSILGLLLLCACPDARSTSITTPLGLNTGRDIYQAACAACHGAHGEGTAEDFAGFTRPDTFPSFDRCEETTPESTRNWAAIVRDGGPARGFSPIMPAFEDALTPEQINKVVEYLRGLCTEPEWPRGELNVPRALFTEKAFPESELVLTAAFNAKGAPEISNELSYEKKLGARDQLEIAVPFGWIHQDSGGLYGGIGDIALGLKHVLFTSLYRNNNQPIYESRGSILSLQGEVSLPTGNADRGLGSGETSFGISVAYDRLLPANAFLQVQAGADLPLHADEVSRSAFLYSVLGKSFYSRDGSGRMWTPMLEVLAERDLVGSATTHWDIVPEFQVTLNRRQHVRAALGYRIPLNDTADRPKQIVAYILWDWFDGGLLEGW